MGRINNDAAFFMSYVRGDDRGQAALLPAAIEDYVAADAPVRVATPFVTRCTPAHVTRRGHQAAR
jgi:hypothetical protein